MNQNGKMFSNFFASHDLIIGGTIFPHKKCHKVAWVSPDHTKVNQIDHIAVDRKLRSSLTDVRNKRGADIGSDHHLVLAEFKLRIMVAGKKFESRRKKVIVQKLKGKKKYEEFKVELRNHFQVLSSLSEDCDDDVNIKWMKIKEVYLETSEKVLGYRDQKQKEWMSDETWNKIKDMKEIKSRINNSKTQQQKAIAQAQYTEANVQVKRSVRRDKRRWVDELAQLS
jgi:hypothetical protein